MAVGPDSTISAGDKTGTDPNEAGGTLNLRGGKSDGTEGSKISFQVAVQGAGGSGAHDPEEKVLLDETGLLNVKGGLAATVPDSDTPQAALTAVGSSAVDDGDGGAGVDAQGGDTSDASSTPGTGVKGTGGSRVGAGGYGVHGIGGNPLVTGFSTGVRGQGKGAAGIGVEGVVEGAAGWGVVGTNTVTGGVGVQATGGKVGLLAGGTEGLDSDGAHALGRGTGHGVLGYSGGPPGTEAPLLQCGVGGFGRAVGSVGVYGQAGSGGSGVFGYGHTIIGTDPEAPGIGVSGQGWYGGAGVDGKGGDGATGGGAGVHGVGGATTDTGLDGAGVLGEGGGDGGVGVRGEGASETTTPGVGVEGQGGSATGITPANGAAGVFGKGGAASSTGVGGAGVYGEGAGASVGASGIGVEGRGGGSEVNSAKAGVGLYGRGGLNIGAPGHGGDGVFGLGEGGRSNGDGGVGVTGIGGLGHGSGLDGPGVVGAPLGSGAAGVVGLAPLRPFIGADVQVPAGVLGLGAGSAVGVRAEGDAAYGLSVEGHGANPPQTTAVHIEPQAYALPVSGQVGDLGVPALSAGGVTIGAPLFCFATTPTCTYWGILAPTLVPTPCTSGSVRELLNELIKRASEQDGGGEVRLGAGAFVVNGPIELRDNVRLVGLGPNVTTLQLDPQAGFDNSNVPNLIEVEPAQVGGRTSNVGLRDLTLVGVGYLGGDAIGTNKGAGCSFANVEQAEIVNCVVTNMTSDGVRIYSTSEEEASQRCSIRQSAIYYNGGHGISTADPGQASPPFVPVSDLVVNGCTVAENGRRWPDKLIDAGATPTPSDVGHGILLDHGAESTEIQACRISTNTGDALRLQNACAGTRVFDTALVEAGHYRDAQGDEVAVPNDAMGGDDTTHGNGLHVTLGDASSAQVSDTQVGQNSVLECLNHGMRLDDVQGVVATTNTCIDNGESSIEVVGDSAVIITANTLTGDLDTSGWTGTIASLLGNMFLGGALVTGSTSPLQRNNADLNLSRWLPWGPSGQGLYATGTGSGAGVEGIGGPTQGGVGVKGSGGSGGGEGVRGLGTLGFTGVVGTGGPSDGTGVAGTGGGGGTGVKGTGGTSGGTGVEAVGTGTADGVVATGGPSNGDGVLATGQALGVGVRAIGGSNADGVVATGNGAGAGVRATAAGTGDGVIATGGGAGVGLRATGGATGSAVVATSGGTSGSGVVATAAGASAGVHATGGASSGVGVHAIGGANGRGVVAVGTGAAAGLEASAGTPADGDGPHGIETQGGAGAGTNRVGGSGLHGTGGAGPAPVAAGTAWKAPARPAARAWSGRAAARAARACSARRPTGRTTTA